MLSHLSIQNVALIDSLTIEFCEGFNVMTGETGAGKSIIVDSIGLILGERADKELIQTGKDYAQVEGVFYLKAPEQVMSVLQKYGIPMEDDGTLLIMRQLSRSGRNICRINGHMVTLSVLKEIGQHLVDIHGQHQHQSLLNPETHIDILDRLGGQAIAPLKQEVQKLYSQWKAVKQEIDDLINLERDGERMKDLLAYQINEIEAANLKVGEDVELLNERSLLQNAEKVIGTIQEAYEILYAGGDRAAAVVDQLAKVMDGFGQIAKLNYEFERIAHDIENIYYHLEDVIDRIRNLRDSFEYDPERLNEIEARLSLIHSLKRKYGATIEDILSLKEELKEQLSSIECSQEKLDQLRMKEREIYGQLIGVCAELSKKRRELAESLEQQLVSQLKELGMEKTRFKVEILSPDDDSLEGKQQEDYRLSYITPQGFDRVEFLISPNPGEPLKPLAKIISGGEMSRVMLAFKTVLAEKDDIPTLIFDEIDTGISGRIASAVAEKMNALSRSHQVICITHLPQIAVMADRHYKIEKRVCDGRTVTQVNLLDDKGRQMEIAKLIGGAEVSNIGLEHAQELIDAARKVKAIN
ncbi:DNA repair protein RecN (Recombination protein N) [Caldicoprobacter guelmensis]|uniref:DNA repair protein RecN n=1 Tax=Caldicoprobacter guelmensis TaxID=1170224 RepID=UPI00195CC285|nr:DNA repair protein RecN [Caldicoprobacter guelmensis]MBM7581306.1 DNA repair protein RecN (Recombination protein N) [Caldicoprobacter guelmensis]